MCTPEQIKTNTCSFDVNEALCIKWACTQGSSYNPDTANSPDIFVADAVLAATMMIGTVVTLALVVSGFKYIMAGGEVAQASDAKKWIKNAVIWLFIVTFSYTIIRLIQYLVAWYR